MSDAEQLYGAVRQGIDRIAEQWKAAMADDQITLAEGVGIVIAAANEVSYVVRTFQGADDGRQLAIDALEAFYDREIAPLDLPKIPNWLEGMADNFLRSLIAPAVTEAWKYFDKFKKAAA